MPTLNTSLIQFHYTECVCYGLPNNFLFVSLIIQETIRQSKESKLDEAGRISVKRSLENVNRIIPG